MLLPCYVVDYTKNKLKTPEVLTRSAYSVLDCSRSHSSEADKVEDDVLKKAKDAPQVSSRPKVEKKTENDSELAKYSSGDDDVSDSKWRLELAWLTKAVEPALQLCRWAVPSGLCMVVMFSVSSNLQGGSHRVV